MTRTPLLLQITSGIGKLVPGRGTLPPLRKNLLPTHSRRISFLARKMLPPGRILLTWTPPPSSYPQTTSRGRPPKHPTKNPLRCRFVLPEPTPTLPTPLNFSPLPPRCVQHGPQSDGFSRPPCPQSFLHFVAQSVCLQGTNPL